VTADPSPPDTPPLRVRTADGRTLEFTKPFRIGRAPTCEVCIDDSHISREHVALASKDGRWYLRDMQSANGVFVKDRRVASSWIDQPLTIGLGEEGPFLRLEPSSAPSRGARPADATVARGDEPIDLTDGDRPVGRRTRAFIDALQGLQRKQRRYRWIVAVAVLAALAVAGYAISLRFRISKQQALAQQLFYEMKALDVEIANLERSIGTQDQEQVRRYLERRRQMESNYEEFLASLNVRGGKVSEQERLILKVTRIFGECDIAAPQGYVGEVSHYIRRWQSTGEFARAVKRARDNGYVERIIKEFQEQDLPPQFFYLALQESKFDPFASGPITAYGHAKGMWQFIPDTGREYGLSIGPLVKLPRPDPLDDRHDWQKATRAAARYIKFIYSTDAQASGLLVMASYNWGERRVIRLVRSLPANPRDRNFWQLLEKYRNNIPPETYNYVFSIVSAAVIGENPRLFGFPFDNPLAQQGSAAAGSIER
jgi:pSer/pThr/pTyr-binding forkhead associated (FHA) protein